MNRFTYSVGFAALIASAANNLNYWTHDIPGVTVGIIYIALPCVLIAINKLEIGVSLVSLRYDPVLTLAEALWFIRSYYWRYEAYLSRHHSDLSYRHPWS